MSNTHLPEKRIDSRHLKWKTEVGYQIATHESCLIFRESPFSMISGIVFGLIIGGGGVGTGIWTFTTQRGADAVGFGIVVTVIGLFFLLLLFFTARRGIWSLVYDRGDAQLGRVGEIRYRGGRIGADEVQWLSTRDYGGNVPRGGVVAVLKNGKVEALGPIGVLTWPEHWAKMAADWMQLPYQPPPR